MRVLAQGLVAVLLVRVAEFVFNEQLGPARVPFPLFSGFLFMLMVTLELLSFFFQSVSQFGAMNFECLGKS